MTNEDIARVYPQLTADQQANALQVWSAFDDFLKLAVDETLFPSTDVRKMFLSQAAGMRNSAIAMIGQK